MSFRSLLSFVVLLGFSSLAVAQSSVPPELEPVRAAFRAQDFDRATALGEAIVAAQPDHARAWQWLGRSYGQQALRAGMLGKASLASKCRKAYERSVALDPSHTETQYELLEFYTMAPGIVGGGEDRARPQAARIAKLDPIFGKLAQALVAMRIDEDLPAAERALREAAATAGAEQRRARLTLGSFLANAGRWADVRALWTGVLATSRDDATALYMLGRTASLSGEELEAGLAALDRFLALAALPEDMYPAPAYWRRGLILEKLGRVDEAIASIERAVALDPKLESAKKDLARLE